MTLSEYVEAYIRSHGLSVREFANHCKLSHSLVNSILNNRDYKPDIKTLMKIADYTGIKIVTLLKMTYPEAFELDQNRSLDEQLVEAFEKASPEVQEIVLKIIGLK